MTTDAVADDNRRVHAVSSSPVSMKRTKLILDGLFYGALLLSAACGTFFLLRRSLADTESLRARRDALQEENRQLEERLNDYRRRKAELSMNPEYIEKIARDQGLVAPGETVFVFPEEEP